MEKGDSFALLVGMQTGPATVESCIELPQKVKNGSAFWPSDPTSGNISEGTQNTNSKENKHLYVHCSIIYNRKIWKQPKCPSVDEWIKQHLHNGILLSPKKKKILSLATVWTFLKKLKMDLPFDPAIPLLGIYLKEPKMLFWNKISTSIFIATLFTIAKIWKQPKCPSVDEWIKQLWDIYTMEYYSAVKNEENFTLCDSIYGPGAVSYTHLTLPTTGSLCRSRWSPYH